MNQLQGYIGNSPWCFSVDRARSFASDSFCPTPGIRRVENYQDASCSRNCKKCEAGGSKDGGTPLVKDVCTNYCSYPNLPQSYWKCGTGDAYKYGQNPPSTKGIDCRSCATAWCKDTTPINPVQDIGNAAYECMSKNTAAECINDIRDCFAEKKGKEDNYNKCITCDYGSDSQVICGVSDSSDPAYFPHC